MESIGFLIYILVIMENNLTVKIIPVILFSWGQDNENFSH